MLTFENRVVVITGAARGLGLEHARYFASRKAKLFLNDVDKENGVNLIDAVAESIRKQYGVEVATDNNSVEEGHKIIENAVNVFKRIDVLVNNAGQLIDRGMSKITQQDFDNIIRVHLKGAFRCTLAAWPYFRKQKYGRIINTSSAAGLFGNFGQTAYSSAKAGILGMTMALAKEGENLNIKVNAIAPLADTRMTQGVIPDDLIVSIPAKLVSPLVTLLAHEECPENGQIFEIGGGWIAKLRWERTEGGNFPLTFTPEMLKENWEKVTDFSRKCDYSTSGSDSIERMFNNFEFQTKGKQPEPQNEGVVDSKTIYRLMKVYVEEGKADKAIKKCNSIYQFVITENESENIAFQFWVSVKPENQSAGEGVHKSPDATFTISNKHFFDVCIGKLNPQVAFTKKMMKIKGNFKKATAFTPDLFPQPTKENVEKYLKGKAQL